MEDEDDVKELKEVMETLRDTVPAIIRGIVDALYSSQNAGEFGKQVANFYKSMIEAGMDKHEAFELTKEFMESRDVAGIVKKMLSEGDWKKWGRSSQDIEEKVNKTIKETMDEWEKEKNEDKE